MRLVYDKTGQHSTVLQLLQQLVDSLAFDQLFRGHVQQLDSTSIRAPQRRHDFLEREGNNGRLGVMKV